MAAQNKQHAKKYTKKHPESEQATTLARGIQKPGQSKEQTKLVAQGIQKGIELYKKQHKAKARELDKQLKKAKNVNTEVITVDDQDAQVTPHRSWLPWALLVLSWAAFAGFEGMKAGAL